MGVDMMLWQGGAESGSDMMLRQGDTDLLRHVGAISFSAKASSIQSMTLNVFSWSLCIPAGAGPNRSKNP